MEKYSINLDENNYIVSIGKTSFGDVEIDLSAVDLSYINAYKYIDGEITLDEEKKAELIAERETEDEKRQEIPIKAEAFDILLGETE